MPRKDPISHLARHAGPLPPRLADEIVALGPAAVASLVALVDDPAATVTGSPAERSATHAVTLLARFDHPDVAPALLRAFATWPSTAPGIVRVKEALEAFAGPALVEPLLAVNDPERATAATLLLSACKVLDPRIRDRVVALLAEPGVVACVAAARYVTAPGAATLDEPQLLSAVHAAFDEVMDRFRTATHTRLAAIDAALCTEVSDLVSQVQLYLRVMERLGDNPVERTKAFALDLARWSATIQERARELDAAVASRR